MTCSMTEPMVGMSRAGEQGMNVFGKHILSNSD